MQFLSTFRVNQLQLGVNFPVIQLVVVTFELFIDWFQGVLGFLHQDVPHQTLNIVICTAADDRHHLAVPQILNDRQSLPKKANP